jgi:hypothetical protein
VLSGNTLELSDLPVERVAPHGNQELGRSIHQDMILPMRSAGNRHGLPLCGLT